MAIRTAKKKRAKTGGRQKGVPNKVSATVKMMILDTLDKLGGVKYLKEQAAKHPVAFMSLLGRIMPTQVVGDVTHQFVARIPAPEGNADEWLKKYAPNQPQLQRPH